MPEPALPEAPEATASDRWAAAQDAEEIKRLKREVAELRRANEILKSASVFFAKELDRPTTR